MHKKNLAPIKSGVVYPLETFKMSAGFGSHAMRSMRKKGLIVRRIGGRAFVLGDDFISFLSRLDEQENGSDGTQ